ncbi:MAG: hypothetical protein JO317_04485, partial [Verrucomicrobiae bacterium]|nr:hypothetical protein [Verrucomicrobiae bacterium]
MKNSAFRFAFSLAIGFALLHSRIAKAGDTFANHLGVAHANGKYHFTNQPFEVEGAEQIWNLGSRAIKLWLEPEDHDLVKLAKSDPYAKVLARPFHVVAFEALRFTYVDFGKLTPDKLKEEEQAFYDLTKYLLTTYSGTGKVFILQNWEGDRFLTSAQTAGWTPDADAYRGMVEWLNARQAGVDRARKEVVVRDVSVYHAAEADQVIRKLEGQPCVASEVFPKTHCDLYSYAAYEAQYDPRALLAAIRFLRQKAPDSDAFADNNVYIGEFGWAENETPAPEIVEHIGDVAALQVREKIPYAFYWQIYCNELVHPGAENPGNADLKGFWLVRADKTLTPMYDKMHALMPLPFKEGPDFKYAYERKQSATPTPAYRVPKLAAAPNADGNLGEWKDKALKIPLREAIQVVGIENWKPENLSADFYLGYTADALWIGAEVTDDVQLQKQTGEGIWLQDSIQVSIDPRHDQAPFYDPDDQELGLALGDDGKPQLWSWHLGSKAKDLVGYTSGVRRDGTKTVYELSVPWSALDIDSPGAGSVIGLSFLVNDDDGAGRGWIELTPGIGKTKDPSVYPSLTLAP